MRTKTVKLQVNIVANNGKSIMGFLNSFPFSAFAFFGYNKIKRYGK